MKDLIETVAGLFVLLVIFIALIRAGIFLLPILFGILGHRDRRNYDPRSKRDNC